MDCSKPSAMLSAFLSQSNIDDQKADQLEALRQEAHNMILQKAMLQLASPQNIPRNNFPSKIKDGELDQKTESHKQLKNYNHSLEKVRIKFPSGKNVENFEKSNSNDMFDGSNDVN